MTLKSWCKKSDRFVVSVPSHPSLMAIASTKLRLVLDEIKLNKPIFPIIQNFHAKVPITLTEIADNLSNQISKPVQWVSSMQRLKKYGLDMHLEFGPNKVLSGLAKQNRVTGEFISLDNIDRFKELLQHMENKKILVTGGSRGIGKAVVESFINDGHQVLTTCRDPKKFFLNIPF